MVHQYIDEQEAWKLYRIFNVNGLPKLAAWSIVRQLQRWEKSRGMKWVVSHLKVYATDLLTGSGKIKKNQDGSWKGLFSPIFRLAHTSRLGLAQAVRILRITGRYESRACTLEDYKAFKLSLQVPLTYSVPELKITPEDRYLAKINSKADFDMAYDMTAAKSSPVGNGVSRKRSQLTPEDHLQALNDCPNLVLRHHYFFERLFHIRPYSCYESEAMIRPYDYVGNVIGLTKDRGLKQRFVANPAYFLQVALSRLKAVLMNFLKDMPESCVHNQSRGPKWIRRQLKIGRSVSSIDLSKCSDNLPAPEQFSMLRDLFRKCGLDEDIDLFESVCKGRWYTPMNRTLFVEWEKGQPLGTAPSFACFTIFHILLVRSVGGDPDTFRVIGDDIVISSDSLTDKVIELYSQLQVDISIHKSIFKSKTLAEFAGRLVDKRGILPVYKASPFDFEMDPFGYIRQYGQAGLKLLPKKCREVVEVFASLPPPYGYGKYGKLANLPDALVYELYTHRFEPVKRSPPTEVMKEWTSEFSRGIIREDGCFQPIVPKPRKGEGDWLLATEVNSAEFQRTQDHVLSFHGSPLEDVPDIVLELESKLSESAPARVDDVHVKEPPKPIGFVKKVVKLVLSFRDKLLNS